MFQPRVKLEFVGRYCAPQDGWCVCVDIDPSEEGRTGTERESHTARKRWLFGTTWTNSADDCEGVPNLRQPDAFVWDGRLTEKDKEFVAELNAALECLNEGRAIEINVAGPFARSKIAWKLAVHQQGLLHRLIALMDGTSVAWNNRRTLSAILCARALMETIAVMSNLESPIGDP